MFVFIHPQMKHPVDFIKDFVWKATKKVIHMYHSWLQLKRNTCCFNISILMTVCYPWNEKTFQFSWFLTNSCLIKTSLVSVYVSIVFLGGFVAKNICFVRICFSRNHCFVHPIFHFWFLVTWRRSYENMKILRNLCLHSARQDRQDEQDRNLP